MKAFRNVWIEATGGKGSVVLIKGDVNETTLIELSPLFRDEDDPHIRKVVTATSRHARTFYSFNHTSCETTLNLKEKCPE